MEGYTLSEKGKEYIRTYERRRVIVKVLAVLAGFLVALILIGMMHKTVELLFSMLLAWLPTFLVIFGSNMLFTRLLDADYTDILNKDCDPYLFLEVHHGMMRVTNNSQKANNINMLYTAEAYINMGQYEDALHCISPRYLQASALNKKENIIYLYQIFRCMYGMNRWKEIREEFSTFKATIEEFQETTHKPKMIVWSEQIYEDVRKQIMNYDILTTEGSSYISDMVSDIRNHLEEEQKPIETAQDYYMLGCLELARENYEAAEQAFSQVIKVGNRLWMAELARRKIRMIHERDRDIALVMESELSAVRAMINAQNAHQQEPVTESDLRDNILYVLHEEGEVAGVARITNQMKLGQMLFLPSHDSDKNQFRLMQEMKRRDYVREDADL